MITLELDDDERLALTALIAALGGGRPAHTLPFLASIAGQWVFTLGTKLSAANAADVDNDTIRAALGQFAATAQTQQEVNDLRRLHDVYRDRDADAHTALRELGCTITDTAPVRTDDFTTAARTKLADDARTR